jgi:hypothetical protein
MVSCQEAQLSEAKEKNGSLPAANQLDNTRPMYLRALMRFFLAAFDCSDNDLCESVSNQGRFEDVKQVLLSDHYREHWVPILVALSTRSGFVSVVEQLTQLGNKVEFLPTLKSGDQKSPDLTPAKEIVGRLVEAAKQFGLSRSSPINPSAWVRQAALCYLLSVTDDFLKIDQHN